MTNTQNELLEVINHLEENVEDFRGVVSNELSTLADIVQDTLDHDDYRELVLELGMSFEIIDGIFLDDIYSATEILAIERGIDGSEDAYYISDSGLVYDFEVKREEVINELIEEYSLVHPKIFDEISDLSYKVLTGGK